MSLGHRLLVLLLALAVPACSGSEDPAGGQTAPGPGASNPGPEAPNPGQGESQSGGALGNQQKVDPLKPALLEVRLKMKGTGEMMGGVPFDVQWDDEGAPSKTASRTDPDGTRTLPFDHGAQLIAIIPRSSAYTAPILQHDKTLMLGGVTYVVEVEVPPGGITTGTVYSETGDPVPGATVTAFFNSPDELDRMSKPSVDIFTTTDDNGNFAMGGFPAGPFVLESGDDGRVSVFRPGGLIREGQRLDGLEIFLEPAHEVYGQVIDQEERPIAGARVVAGKPARRQNRKPTEIEGIWLYQARAVVAKSDEDGLFTLPAVPMSQIWNLNVTHPDFRRGLGLIEAGQIDVWITLEQGASVEGMVRGEDGRPMSQVQIWMFWPTGQDTTFTGLDGRYHFGGRPPTKDVYLVFYKEGAGMLLEGPMEINTGTEALDVELEGGQILGGLVVDADEKPLVGAMVTIEGRLPSPDYLRARMPERFLEMDAQITNSEGRFLFTELDDNHFEIRISAPGVGEKVLENIPSGRNDLLIKLD